MAAEPTPSAPGVYLIRNMANGRVYVGRSENIARRFGSHAGMLRRGTHHNARLQADWNEFGESAFKFEVHALADESQIARVEKILIEENLGDGCYNCSATRGGPSWVRMQTDVPADVARRVRVLAAYRDVTVPTILKEAVEQYVVREAKAKKK